MITYNRVDNIYYGTEAERTGVDGDVIKAKPSAKFYTYDGKLLYLTDGTTWDTID
jgi:hypothetical protein